jgi:hypothetical protein
MRTLFTLVSAGTIAALSMLAASAKDAEQDITLDKVPKAVLDADKARFKVRTCSVLPGDRQDKG